MAQLFKPPENYRKNGALPRAAKRRLRQINRHPFRHRVSNELTVEQVLDARQVQPALGGADVRQIRHPHLIGRIGRELSF